MNSTDPNNPLLGRTVAGRYELVSVLGRGGMGIVFSARRMSDGARVALKMLRDATGDEARFEREARLVASLEHPGIVRLLDFGHDAALDGAFLVMEYVDGVPLSDLVERGPLDWETALRIARPIAEAMEFAHLQGVVHRDIKPENIMMVGPPDDLRPVLLDFGLARSADAAYRTLTEEGFVFGTPHFMAPEQGLGPRVGPPADVYSLGAVMFEMLTGRLPLEQEGSPIGLLVAKQRVVPPRVNDVVPAGREVPEPVQALVAQMLSIDPGVRPRSVVAKLEGLGASNDVSLQLEEIERTLAPARTKKRRPSKSNGAQTPTVARRMASAAAGGLLLTMVLGLIAILALDDEEPLPDPASPSAALAIPPPSAEPEAVEPPEAEAVDSGQARLDTGTDMGEPDAPVNALATGKPRPSAGCEGYEPKPGLTEDGVLMYVPSTIVADEPRPLVYLRPREDQTLLTALDHTGFREFAERHRLYLIVRGGQPGTLDEFETAEANHCIDLRFRFAIAYEYGTRLLKQLQSPGAFSAIVIAHDRISLTSKEAVNPGAPLLRIEARDNPIFPAQGGLSCEKRNGLPFRLIRPLSDADRAPGALARSEWDLWRSAMKCADGTIVQWEGATCTRWDCETPLETCEVLRGGRRWSQQDVLTTNPECVAASTPNFAYFELIWDFFERRAQPRSPEH